MIDRNEVETKQENSLICLNRSKELENRNELNTCDEPLYGIICGNYTDFISYKSGTAEKGIPNKNFTVPNLEQGDENAPYNELNRRLLPHGIFILIHGIRVCQFGIKGAGIFLFGSGIVFMII